MSATTTVVPKRACAYQSTVLWRVGISGSVLLLLTFLPVPLKPDVLLCGFLRLTGRPCPFCGLTRAMACLLKGDFALALTFHPLSPLALAAFLIMFLGEPCRTIWERTGCRTVPKERLRFFWIAWLLLFLVYGCWRIWMGNHS